MGRKKKRQKAVIFCYYCDRVFDSEKVLMQHQRATHFKCPECYKRINSAVGMMEHAYQVHKIELKTVPNAKPGRDSFEIDIFGMGGVPPEIVEEKRAKIYGEPNAKQARPNPGPHMQTGPLIPGTPSTLYASRSTLPRVMPMMMMPRPGFMPGVPMMGAPMMMPRPNMVPQPVPMMGRGMPIPGQPMPGAPMPGQPMPGQPPMAGAPMGAPPMGAPGGPPGAAPQMQGPKSTGGPASTGAPGPPSTGPPGGMQAQQAAPPPMGAPPMQKAPPPAQQPGRQQPPNNPYGRPPTNMPGMVAPGHPQYQPPANPYGAPAAQGGRAPGAPQEAKRKKMVRLWEEELVSQEEKRASHPRYQQFVQNRISNLQDSIEKRLQALA